MKCDATEEDASRVASYVVEQIDYLMDGDWLNTNEQAEIFERVWEAAMDAFGLEYSNERFEIGAYWVS